MQIVILKNLYVSTLVMVDLHINSGLKCVDQGGLLSPGDITGL